MNEKADVEKLEEEIRYQSLAEFYPFYLSQHNNIQCRRLHFVGTFAVILVLIAAFYTERWMVLLWAPLLGYGFAWVGHFYFEKNRPATFTYPMYSFICDWIMFKDILIGKIKI